MEVVIPKLLVLALLQCFIGLAFSKQGIQIITSDEEFLNGLGERIQEQWGMSDNGSSYEVVAIMGSQSSGKSTLLNNLFGTDFVVMDPKEHKRTTNGIWLSRDRAQNILVMDVEGSDSNARRDDQNFERKSALFALACSRVLIVNLWENQVGLYTGANLGLLSVIFEEYLVLFGDSDRRSDRPQIMFIIQAHSGTTSLESLAQMLTRDLMAIWEGVSKPEELRDRSATDYFDFKFNSLPHLVLDSEHYQDRANILREQFANRNSEDYVFKNAYSSTIPADGLESYMRATWEKIRLNQKLNLPGQHELIARLMCDKICASLLEEYRSHITSKLSLFDNGRVLEDLLPTMQSWKDDVLGLYDKDAGRYVQHVFIEKRISLIRSFHMEVSRLFYKQLKNVRHSLLADFGKELEGAMGKEDEEFDSFVSDARVKYEQRFEEGVMKVAIHEAEWQWKDELEELRSGMAEKVKARKRDRVTPLGRTERLGANMRTTATLYRDGGLVVQTASASKRHNHGFRGRVLIALRDIDGNAIGLTGVLRCTTRGGKWDPTTDSSGDDVFSLKFPGEVARRAFSLDIWQSGDGSLDNVHSMIAQVAPGIAIGHRV